MGQAPWVIAENKKRYENAHENRLYAYNRRLAGVPYQQIAKELGISRQRVAKIVRDHMKELETEALEEVRRYELDRLDKLQVAIDDLLSSNDPELRMKGIDRALKISESRRKLYGMDELDRSQINAAENKTQAEINLDKLLKEAQDRVQAEEEAMRSQATKEE